MHLKNSTLELVRQRPWRRTGLLALALAGIACADSKPTLAVLPVQAGDASPEDAEAFRSELDRVFRSSADVRYVDASASSLAEVDAAGGCMDVECAVQAGRVLDADRVVAPIVRKDGENWVMTLRLVDARSGEVTVSKAGLSGSPSASGAASDFASALTEPVVAALHVVEPAVATAAVGTSDVNSSGLEASGSDLPPVPAGPAPSGSSSNESSGGSGKGKKILLWTAGGLVLAGGVAAAVVLLTGKSTTQAENGTNNGGGGTPTDDTMTVTVRWK